MTTHWNPGMETGEGTVPGRGERDLEEQCIGEGEKERNTMHKGRKEGGKD